MLIGPFDLAFRLPSLQVLLVTGGDHNKERSRGGGCPCNKRVLVNIVHDCIWFSLHFRAAPQKKEPGEPGAAEPTPEVVPHADEEGATARRPQPEDTEAPPASPARGEGEGVPIEGAAAQKPAEEEGAEEAVAGLRGTRVLRVPGVHGLGEGRRGQAGRGRGG